MHATCPYAASITVEDDVDNQRRVLLIFQASSGPLRRFLSVSTLRYEVSVEIHDSVPGRSV